MSIRIFISVCVWSSLIFLCSFVNVFLIRQPRPLFCLFLLFSNTNFTQKTVSFTGIQILIAGKEGERARWQLDHHHHHCPFYVLLSAHANLNHRVCVNISVMRVNLSVLRSSFHLWLQVVVVASAAYRWKTNIHVGNHVGSSTFWSKPICYASSPTDRPTDLPTYRPTYVPTYLPTYLPIYLPTYNHLCMPFYLIQITFQSSHPNFTNSSSFKTCDNSKLSFLYFCYFQLACNLN